MLSKSLFSESESLRSTTASGRFTFGGDEGGDGNLAAAAALLDDEELDELELEEDYDPPLVPEPEP